MKQLLFIILACLDLCHCAPSSSTAKTPRPSEIALGDKNLSTTIRCQQVDGKWSLATAEPAVAAYLAQVGKYAFEIDGITNFREIEIAFDSLYTKGAFTAIGTKNGSNVPIGVEYALRSTSKGKIKMTPTERHTCTSNGSTCCRLFIVNGDIVGCEGKSGCTGTDVAGKCNHSLTNKQ